MARLFRLAALRALVLALALPISAASGMPAMVRALGGSPAHHCTCPIRGSRDTCSCPVCHPGDARYEVSKESLRGQCGDDDGVSTAAPVLLGVPVAALLGRAPLTARADFDPSSTRRPDEPTSDPPVRPPTSRAS